MQEAISCLMILVLFLFPNPKFACNPNATDLGDYSTNASVNVSLYFSHPKSTTKAPKRSRRPYNNVLCYSTCQRPPAAAPIQYVRIFEVRNMRNSSTVPGRKVKDMTGININTFKSIKSDRCFVHKNGTANMNLNIIKLKGGEPMKLQVEYYGVDKKLNAGFFIESTASHYAQGCSFKLNVEAAQIETRLKKKKEFNKWKLAFEIEVSIIGFLILFVLILGAFLVRRQKKFVEEELEDWEVQYGPHKFSYKELSNATKGFNDIQFLGRGGFGRVYRGVLPTLRIWVAVKRIARDSRQGMREFVAEIATIGCLRHPNLVRLLGYCRHEQELLLVYDFMPNGSLDKFLYGQPEVILNWVQRFKIIKDIASGLLYLHHQWVQVVIHRDVKASNVLIDGEFNGKLGDFGLAKLCDDGSTDPQISPVAGTFGYMAPELSLNGNANRSTDLFAFGAFMLVVVCGRRPVERRAPPEEIILRDWVLECLKRGNILDAVDQRLGSEYAVEEVELALKLGLLCSHAVAAVRPNMFHVVKYLKGEAQLPDNFSDIIESQDFGEASNGEDAPPISIPILTNSEPFVSVGR